MGLSAEVGTTDDPKKKKEARQARTMKASGEKRASLERQSAFDNYQSNKSSYDELSDGYNSLDYRVKSNLSLARDLEKRASTQDWTGQPRGKSVMGFGLREAIVPFGRGLSYIQSKSYKSQAEHLRKGGKPVYDKYENYQGVVHKNWLGHTSYSGRLGFDPLGRSDVNYDTATGSYTSSFKEMGDGGSESSNVNTSNVDANNVTDSQSASVKPTVRKSLLAQNMSAGGDAKRRGLINARKLT